MIFRDKKDRGMERREDRGGGGAGALVINIYNFQCNDFLKWRLRMNSMFIEYSFSTKELLSDSHTLSDSI